MNTKKIAIASIVGAFAVMALLVAYPAIAASPSASQSTSPSKLLQQSVTMASQKIQLTDGQTITLSSVAGGWWVIGDRADNGTATGTMTLQVTGVLKGGYIISVTGGSFNINGTTYGISSGSAELGPHRIYMVGNGQAGSAQFLFQDRSLGKFGSTGYGVLRVDLKDGTSEFAARLLVTVTVTSPTA
ncbi:MAG TPA: hypothetical protein VEJ19_07070 [Nitrososphaerales archaeon]|nr:hypothetical protein [Nitrososphaerales archaeon]